LATVPQVQDAAKRRYLHCEIRFLHGGVGPYRGHDFVLWDEISVSLNQHAKDVERAGAEADWHRDASMTEPGQAAQPVKAETAEQKAVGRGVRVHVLAL